MVDCFVEPTDLKMSREDFIARIVEPMVARLLKGFDEPNDDSKFVHFRMWMAPVSELQLEFLEV